MCGSISINGSVFSNANVGRQLGNEGFGSAVHELEPKGKEEEGKIRRVREILQRAKKSFHIIFLTCKITKSCVLCVLLIEVTFCYEQGRFLCCH